MILPLAKSQIPEVKRLVLSVFPFQTPVERLFYWAWKNRSRPIVQRLLRRQGIHSLDDIWVSQSADGAVEGTIGLYSYEVDCSEARWVSWFCVAPEARGRGVGSRLLDFLIEETRGRGYRYLRLYTGSDPDEAKAQILYESRGLRETRREPKLGYDRIYRELELGPAGARAG